MSCEDIKVLDIHENQKSDTASFIIHADLECLIEKTDGRKNNPEKSSTTKVAEHVPSGFSMSTISLFKSIENMHDVYRGKDCMKKLYESLREHAIEIINFKKKKVKLLINEQQKSDENVKFCCICKQKLEDIHDKDKKVGKLETIVIIQVDIEELHIAYVI